jgi:hypothetical protein
MANNKSSNSEVAVLQTQMDDVLQKLGEISAKIDNQSNTFVSKEVFELKIAEIEAAILGLQNRKSLINWVTPTISAVLGSVLTGLIIYTITH